MLEPSDFRFHCELSAYEKADAPDGQRMRIGGIASTEALDADGERLVQEGLDFKPFLERGWFNDNHGKGSLDVVGYPTGARLVKQGEALPNGQKSKKRGWWVEGYLLNTEKGRKLWQLAQALEETPRKLGFSVEGSVVQRAAADKVGKAKIKHVAVTHCPKNHESELYTLSKALMAGAPSSESFATRSGGTAGDGAPLVPDSLDRTLYVTTYPSAEGEIPEVELDADGLDLNEMVQKGEDAGIRYESDADYVGTWSRALATSVQAAVSGASPLRKAEARQFLAQRRPDLGQSEIDKIIEHARGA